MEHMLPGTKKDRKRSESRERDRDSRKSKGNPLGLLPTSRSRPGSRPSSKPTSRRGSVTSPGVKPAPAGKFEMIMESPPVILLGSTHYSNGALVAGRLRLDVMDPSGELVLTKFNMVLQVDTTTRKPIAKDCHECAVKHETIKSWDFLSEPKLFQKSRDNQFPWSFLLEGRLPATTNCMLGAVSYNFIIKATTLMGESITLTRPLEVKRAIPPGPDKTSIRIFPPTHLTGKVSMQPVVHAIGKFPVSMSLSGIVEKKEQSQTRWRLKKTMWRIEENYKIKSTPCSKHSHKVNEGKAIQHIDSKQLGSDEIKSGWKTDFDTAGGEITLDFEAQLATKPGHKVSCDLNSQSGLEISHTLVIELIVAEEFVPNKNTNLITPTGAARVLRMQFALNVSERAGMGISWEEEMPPMYEDVPPSPPGYIGDRHPTPGGFGQAVIEDYEGPTIEYFDLERVPTQSGPPVYRERDAAGVNDGLPMREASHVPESSDMAMNRTRQRLGGFRLDEFETEPVQSSWRGRQNSAQENGEEDIDYGEGEAGSTPQAPARRTR